MNTAQDRNNDTRPRRTQRLGHLTAAILLAGSGFVSALEKRTISISVSADWDEHRAMNRSFTPPSGHALVRYSFSQTGDRGKTSIRHYREQNGVRIKASAKGNGQWWNRVGARYTGKLTLYYEDTAKTKRVNKNTFPYSVTGYVRKTGGGYGSGVVARHPRVLLSCAHVFSTNGRHRWLPSSQIRWHRAWDSKNSPTSGGQRIRSYWRWGSYATLRNDGKRNWDQEFSKDFVVAYAHSNLARGMYAGWWGRGDLKLTSSSTYKMIVGYPAGTSGAYLERTGWFRAPYQRISSRYLKVFGHRTVRLSGNSGGPVFVWNPQGRDWRVAGVHVSSEKSLSKTPDLGVTALDNSAHSLINRAIGSATK